MEQNNRKGKKCPYSVFVLHLLPFKCTCVECVFSI